MREFRRRLLECLIPADGVVGVSDAVARNLIHDVNAQISAAVSRQTIEIKIQIRNAIHPPAAGR